jgi:hypothetical protein
VEYEVVKGEQTYEVQVKTDDKTHKAAGVDIKMNVWKTRTTKQALEQNKQTARTEAAPAPTTMARQDGPYNEQDHTLRDQPEVSTQALEQNKQTARIEAAPAPTAAIARRGNLYSDRDRTQTAQMVEELKALPIGQDKGFYQNELKTRGYEITRVNTDSQEELELEAVKKGQSIAVNIDFDETGKSTTIGASTLWAESESTTQTREEQLAGNGVEGEQEKSLAAHPNTEYRSGARQADEQVRPSYADTSDNQ